MGIEQESRENLMVRMRVTENGFLTGVEGVEGGYGIEQRKSNLIDFLAVL